MKVLARDVQEFLDDPIWNEPEEAAWYIDDLDADLDAIGGANPSEKVEIEDWPIAWQGKGPEPEDHPFSSHDPHDPISFASAFQKWKKKRSCTTFTVTVPNEEAAAFEKLCGERKWKARR